MKLFSFKVDGNLLHLNPYRKIIITAKYAKKKQSTQRKIVCIQVIASLRKTFAFFAVRNNNFCIELNLKS